MRIGWCRSQLFAAAMVWAVPAVAGQANLGDRINRPHYRVGDTWKIRIYNSTGTENRTRIIKFLKIKGKGLFFVESDTLPNSQSSLPSRTYSEKSANSMYQFPLSVGQVRSGHHPDSDALPSDTFEYKVIGSENVTTKAGTFPCLKIDVNFTFQGKPYKQVVYFSAVAKRDVRIETWPGAAKLPQISELVELNLK
ncbi:hypothetical protein [Novosphingobium colocasiae]|uniref:hypothetical protein n=1 Tax=Novosphingobium colocasiae TaxID=1256513 RepID=UPI0035B28BFD